jgi:hypothetical protein
VGKASLEQEDRMSYGWIAAAASAQRPAERTADERRLDALVLLAMACIAAAICAFYYLVIR